MTQPSRPWQLTVLASPLIHVEPKMIGRVNTVAAIVHRGGWAESLNEFFAEQGDEFEEEINRFDWKSAGSKTVYAPFIEHLVEKLGNHFTDNNQLTRVSIHSEGAHFLPRRLRDPSDLRRTEEYINRYKSNMGDADKLKAAFFDAPDQAPVYYLQDDFGLALFTAISKNPKKGHDYFEFYDWDELDEHSAAARLWLGGLIVAEAVIEFRLAPYFVGNVFGSTLDESRPEKLFQRIFASYARKDVAVVESLSSIIQALGVGELRWDVKVLRAGESWAERVYEEIESADSFQLFWSANAKASRWVRKEWEYALQLGRGGFIKPVYWSEPLPAPPRKLKSLHFAKISLEPPRGA